MRPSNEISLRAMSLPPLSVPPVVSLANLMLSISVVLPELSVEPEASAAFLRDTIKRVVIIGMRLSRARVSQKFRHICRR